MQQRLDRSLCNAEFSNLFPSAKVQHFTTTSSNHISILVSLLIDQVVNSTKRFRFENAWLRVDDCDQVVTNSREGSEGLQLQERLTKCGKDL